MEYTRVFETRTETDQYITSVNVQDQKLSVTTKEIEMNPPTNTKQTFSIYSIEFKSSEETIQNILELIYNETDPNRKSKVIEEFSGDITHEFHRYQGNKPEDPDVRSKQNEALEIIIDPNVIYFTSNGPPAIYLNEGGIQPEDDLRDLKNHNTLHIFLDEIISKIDDPVDEEIMARLSETKYGENAKQYLMDGDRCRSQGMTSQAFLSYVLAAEWAGIAYLKEKREQDLIEEQKSGDNTYYFAGRDDSVISKVDKHFGIDQKTIEVFDSLYKNMRNLTAHHKSGKLIDEEIEAVRSRTINFIEVLDSRKKDSSNSEN